MPSNDLSDLAYFIALTDEKLQTCSVILCEQEQMLKNVEKLYNELKYN